MSNLCEEEDVLEVDKKIPGQNYVCMSFISPENVLINKDKYKYFKFIEHVLNNKDNSIIQEFKEGLINYNSISKLYDDWIYINNDKLEETFFEENKFHTSVRGVKIRGVYDTLKEAQIRAQVLQKKDKNFNVYVGQVGYWLPWDPQPDKIENQEYQEKELNDLMKNYKDNMELKEEIFEKNKLEQLEAARKKVELDKEINNQKSNSDDINKINELREIINEKDQDFKKEINETKQDESKEENSEKEKDAIFDEPDPWIQNKLRNKENAEIIKNTINEINKEYKNEDTLIDKKENEEIVEIN